MQLDDMKESLLLSEGSTDKCMYALIHTIRKNVDIFAWTPAGMTDDKERQREDRFPHGRGSLLLHEDAFWSQECGGDISEAGQLCLQGVDRGIMANSEKAKAVMDMPSPKTLKQMQSLSEKLAALNCFMSKSAERSLPFLDMLKKCTNKKDFRWTKVAEAAFLEMKKLVSEMPTLTTPKKGAKTNYAPMEKLDLASVHAARQFMRYFQAHPIKVITDCPIGQVLNNSKASGRLAKWVVELGAYGITYLPRLSVKGQVLADFLADTPAEISATPERLYTDGASNNRGSGTGLILIAPDDVEYSYALRLNFSDSNNEAEYEALLAGLQINFEMHVKDIHVFVDSIIVASQKLYNGRWSPILEILHGPIDEAINLGYFWPSMHRDARELIKACDDCHAHASVPRLPKADTISVTSTWPFMKWGMHIVGPIPEVERENRSLLRRIKTRLEKGGSAWAEEVPNVLWAHRTKKKTSNGETPFSLTYGTESVIPVEIGMPTHRTSSLNEKTNDQELHLNLDILDERREITAIRDARYKQHVEKYYNKKVRHVQFKVGEFILMKNEVSRVDNIGKLGPN
uniref:Uncharacterized protein n=1 Tax=Tanacetum cinerariifolium TaxID=118510 RepID=A0A6L2LTW6_TANCI|nr:hypothetical protein [Tanacetum cinerariifolium]